MGRWGTPSRLRLDGLAQKAIGCLRSIDTTRIKRHKQVAGEFTKHVSEPRPGVGST